MNLYNVVIVKRGRKSKYFLNVRGNKTRTFTNQKELKQAITDLKKAA